MHFIPLFVLFCHYRYYTDLEKNLEESYAALQIDSNYFTEDCTEFQCNIEFLEPFMLDSIQLHYLTFDPLILVLMEILK